jgi:hypothetical protein
MMATVAEIFRLDDRHMKSAHEFFRSLREQYKRSTKKYAINDSQLSGLLAMSMALAERVKALEEQQGQFKYCGTWYGGELYKRGNFCTHNGSVWHCNDEGTSDKPGTSNAWTLAVKHGRAAR